MAEAMSLASHGTLFGRDRELGLLRGMLDAAAAGRGSALVMRGEAGIGKTALLGAIRAEAERRKLTVLAAAGVESESSLPFATLHQLLGPLLSEIDSLPAPHPEVLRAAFGLGVGRPDLYAVALAALELVVDAATIKPVVLILDDVQWLDTASAEAIAFLSRRIGNDAVLAVGATRTVALNDPLRRSGLADTYVTRLDEADATALLEAHAPELPAAVRDRVLAEAAGNPLALVELPRALGQNPVGSLDAEFPLNDRLRATFAARIGDLGNRARTLLVVLAADVNCDVRRLLGAASQAAGETVTISDAQSAIDVGLVELASTMLRFRHPLMRSAVYRQANLLERFAAHGALADQLAAFPDRRLWHLASAALGADESLADELEGYAARAQARGAAMSAIAALRRAAELTDEHQRATSCLLRATELASELGSRHEAERLLQDSDLDRLGPTERGRLANVLEVIRFSGFPDPEQRVRELIEMASETHAAGHRTLSDLARTELRAAGESSRRRTAHIRDQLSAQELQIATLAAQGLTNRQIAERLFLSHRTVGSHLYRIYPRLGIASRAEIAAALEAVRQV
jgi:DNA-binding CsgD family transcriptional regulator